MLQYILNNCTKLTEIRPWFNLFDDDVDKIYTVPLLQGMMSVDGHDPIAKLQVKFPNVTSVMLGGSHISRQYIAEFCGVFSQLIHVVCQVDEIWNPEAREGLINTITSLQHLREFIMNTRISNDELHMITQELPNLEMLILYCPFSRPRLKITSHTFMSLARMPKLKSLRIPVESALEHIQVFTNVYNFPVLSKLRLDSGRVRDKSDIQLFVNKFTYQVANDRPGIKIDEDDLPFCDPTEIANEWRSGQV